MLNVGQLNEGVILDHIMAGQAMDIYKYLKLDKMDCQVAIIKNARSNKMGRKDIIKIECPIEDVDLDVLGFIFLADEGREIYRCRYCEEKYRSTRKKR